MLEKYLKFIKGGKPDEEKTVPGKPASVPEPAVAAPAPSVASAVPLIDPLKPAAEEEVIDTGRFATDNVVASVPEIQTNGQRTSAERLRQKIVGRLPVLDRSQHIIGYELLLRSKVLPKVKKPDTALQLMQDEALIRCLADLNIERMLENKFAFVSISSAMLESPLLSKLPSSGVVLAVRPDLTKLEDILLRCRELRSQGFRIALDDFELKRELSAFLPIASYVRVDVSMFNAIELRNLADHFLDTPGSPQLVANNVATDDDFDACHKMHFHCFEGNYFLHLRPSLPSRVDSDITRVMELLNMVKSQVEISRLEEGFKLDAVLSYKLLRYINAPVNGLQQHIRSIAHALVILGYNQLYRWLTLLMFTSGSVDPRNRALLQNALVRARMTELLGRGKLPPGEQEGLFIVGIFSLLDALLNEPMEQALGRLSLPDQVVRALVRREGVYAPYLALAVACEEADQDAVDQHAAACGLNADEVNAAQMDALVWAEEIGK